MPALFGVQAVCGATVHSASVEHSVRCSCSGLSGFVPCGLFTCFGNMQKYLSPFLFGLHVRGAVQSASAKHSFRGLPLLVGAPRAESASPQTSAKTETDFILIFCQQL